MNRRSPRSAAVVIDHLVLPRRLGALIPASWKLLWLGVVVLPLVMHDQLDTATRNQAGTILWVVVIIAVIPWRHVLNQYVLAPGEPWRRGRHGAPQAEALDHTDPPHAL